jgi:hypothetical protein
MKHERLFAWVSVHFYFNNIEHLAHYTDLAILVCSRFLTQNETAISIVGGDQL